MNTNENDKAKVCKNKGDNKRGNRGKKDKYIVRERNHPQV